MTTNNHLHVRKHIYHKQRRHRPVPNTNNTESKNPKGLQNNAKYFCWGGDVCIVCK